MILEIVAGRLIARHLGSSLYTWTSAIGVVLAGITIGNYLGGRIADRFQTRKVLAMLFGISSVTCVGIIVLNNLVGQWTWLWQLSWPMRVFCHVSSVFLIPSTLLGTISPVVAKLHYLQTHEEHFERAVEKRGLNRGQNTAAEGCIELQEAKEGLGLNSCFATGYDNMQPIAIQGNLHPTPRVGFEPTT